MMQIAVERAEAPAGDKLAELYRTHAPAAGRLAYLMTGDAARAEDLVHDAFVKVIGRFGHLRDPEAFGVYLKRTVVNLANSYFRRRRLERTHEEAQRAAFASPLPASAGADFDEELWEAVLSLPAKQRAAIVLRFFEDFSEAQTADTMGVPVGTVKSMVSRGLQSLRERVQR
jgi:RNA polymerase sigma-70 factor (sigma-E family)